MKIICIVKFVPDVENFIYDYEKNVLVRENVKLILNPDDACALAFALKIKGKRPGTFIEIVSMAPLGIAAQLEDLLRRGADRATLISDKLYSGSDTYATSKILAKYLEGESFDCILSGTHSLDGDTSHIPSQIAELLHINQMSNIVKIEESSFGGKSVIVDVDSEKTISQFEMELPAVFSLKKESKYKLPFVKYKDLNLDVSDRISIVANKKLGFDEDEVGFEGSLTKVARTYVKKLDKREKIVVGNDDEGIEAVYQFLKTKGFV